MAVMKVSLFTFLLVITFSSNAAECLRYKNSTTYTSGAVRYHYDYLGSDIDACADDVVITKAEFNQLLNGTYSDSTLDVQVLTKEEYAVLNTKAEFATTSHEFSSELYDQGLEGIIKLFIAGLGIGAIIAMLFKLRR